MFGSALHVKRLKMAGSCPVVNHVNVAGTTVAVRVLSSGSQAVNQARPNFSQTISRGDVGAPTSTIAGTPAGASLGHSGPHPSTSTVQVCYLWHR